MQDPCKGNIGSKVMIENRISFEGLALSPREEYL
jgi:hypothetical protein